MNKKALVVATTAAMLASHLGYSNYAFASEVKPANAAIRSEMGSRVNMAGTASVTPFDLYGQPLLPAYNDVFKMDNANIKSITNNGGNYPNSAITKAIDGDPSTHWETGKPNSATFTNEVIINFHEETTLNRMVYTARQAGAKGKGFAQQFQIFGSTADSGNNFALVTTGGYTGPTGDTIEIQFAPTAFKRVKFVFVTANQDWASAAEFAFYTEDEVRDAVKGLFTDGTMSAVAPEYNNAAKLNALEDTARTHPLYSQLKDLLELAKEIVNGEVNTENTIITAEQLGDMRKHAEQQLRFGLGTNNQPTGFVAMPGNTIHVYVDVESDSKLPSLTFSQQEGSWSSWSKGVELRPGKNTIIVPEIPTNSAYAHSVTKGGPVYIVNPYTSEEQGKAPRIRFEGLEKFPMMTKDTDPKQFKAALTEYKLRVDQDQAAHPNVTDRKLIDVVEMVSDHIIFTGTASEAYKQYVLQDGSPMDTLTGYDYWMKKNFEFYGLDGRSTQHDPKQIRENIRLMQPYGFMYAAGNHTGIQSGQIELMLGDFNQSYPGWGITHEIGHRMAIGEREYGEITNNMLSMLMSVAYEAIDERIPFEDLYTYIIEENKAVMDQRSLSERLGTYWQLELAYTGYWAELNSLYRERKVSLANGDNSKQQYLIEFSSDVLKTDLSSFFARHGFTVNPETKQKVSKYPESKKLWYLNNSVIHYDGAGITDKNASVKASMSMNKAAKANTLSFQLDKANKSDVLGYEIYRDGTLIGFTGTDQFVDRNIDVSQNYTYKVVVYDKKLNALKPVEFKAFKPTLSVEEHITLKLNQAFDPMDYVKAVDYQGNDITSHITILSNNVDVTQKGNYQIAYKVSNEKAVETKSVNVTVTSDYTYLSDLDAKSASVGWGQLRKDKSPSGGTITLMRQGLAAAYLKGLGAHANSEVVYDVTDKGYDFFESYIGLDQAVKGNTASSATFEVYVDGVKKYESDVFKSGTEHEYVKVPITGAAEVKLVTTDANLNGNSSDHTVWADAKFTQSSSAPVIQVPDETVFIKLFSDFDVLEGVQAYDAEDGDLIKQVEIGLNGFSTSQTGTYNIELSVTDRDGNTAKKNRTVVVYSASSYLSDMDWESATTDYSTVRKDGSSSNQTIKLLVNGQTKEFAKGIGTHANSEIVYNLAGTNFEYFETYVGVDRNIPEQNNSSIRFTIMADGQEVYSSGLMKYGTEAKQIRIPVKGVHQLKLIVDNADNGNASDHANFGDAKFIILNSPPELTIPESVSTKVGTEVPVREAYSAIDPEDGDITSQVSVSGEDQVNFNRTGKYPIVYTVTDRDGNTVSKTRTIAVVDMDDYVYLTDYDWQSTENSYTAPRKDISISGKALRLTDEQNNEVSYERGIGAHSNSTIVYDVSDKNMDYFTSFVGVDRQMYGTVGSISFEVYVDGQKKYDSGVMNSRDPQKYVEVGINGAKQLKLVVTDGGNGNGSDHGAWGNAKLHFANANKLFTGDLVQAIADAKGIDPEGYTPESFAALTEVIAIAETALANPSLSQSDVDAATAGLRTATAGLIRVDLTQVIEVTDLYLNSSIKRTLGITGDITLGDMYQLTALTDDSRRVKSLEGLQYAKNLVTLNVAGSAITDFSPLKGLTKLENFLADPQIVEAGMLTGPVVELDNPVSGRDGLKVIPSSAGVRHNQTFQEIQLDVNDWRDRFTIDLTNEEKGLYTFGVTYEVEGNTVQLIYMIHNK